MTISVKQDKMVSKKLKVVFADPPFGPESKGEAVSESPNLGILYIIGYAKPRLSNVEFTYLEPFLGIAQQIDQFGLKIRGIVKQNNLGAHLEIVHHLQGIGKDHLTGPRHGGFEGTWPRGRWDQIIFLVGVMEIPAQVQDDTGGGTIVFERLVRNPLIPAEEEFIGIPLIAIDLRMNLAQNPR